MNSCRSASQSLLGLVVLRLEFEDVRALPDQSILFSQGLLQESSALLGLAGSLEDLAPNGRRAGGIGLELKNVGVVVRERPESLVGLVEVDEGVGQRSNLHKGPVSAHGITFGARVLGRELTEDREGGFQVS